MLKLLFASANIGKLAEVRLISKTYPVTILGPKDLILEERVSSRVVPQVEENAADYRGNALLKARAFYAWSGVHSIADDTGLEVLALGGRPGVYSARYAGEPSNAEKNVLKLLRELQGIKDRRALFRCVLVYENGATDPIIVESVLEGAIAEAPRGEGGFGYDNIFLVENGDKTLAELKEHANTVETHRVRAFRQLFAALKLPPRLVENDCDGVT